LSFCPYRRGYKGGHWPDAGDRHQAPTDVRAPGRRGQGSIQCLSFCAHTLPNPQQWFDGRRQIRECGHFKQLEHAGRETVTVYRPDLEAVDLEQSADRALDLQLRGDKLHPGGERRAHRLRCRRLDMHRTLVAEAHHFCDSARVVFVGFDRARGQEALGLARLDAHDDGDRRTTSRRRVCRRRGGPHATLRPRRRPDRHRCLPCIPLRNEIATRRAGHHRGTAKVGF
jgi:hypothetical protein